MSFTDHQSFAMPMFAQFPVFPFLQYPPYPMMAIPPWAHLAYPSMFPFIQYPYPQMPAVHLPVPQMPAVDPPVHSLSYSQVVTHLNMPPAPAQNEVRLSAEAADAASSGAGGDAPPASALPQEPSNAEAAGAASSGAGGDAPPAEAPPRFLTELLAQAKAAASSNEESGLPAADQEPAVPRETVLEWAMVAIKRYHTRPVDERPVNGHRPRAPTCPLEMEIDVVYSRFIEDFEAAMNTLKPVERQVGPRSAERVVANRRSALKSVNGKENDIKLGMIIVRFLAYITAYAQSSPAASARPLREVMRLQRVVRVLAEDKRFAKQYLLPSMGIVACFADTYAEFHGYHKGAVDAVFNGHSLCQEPAAVGRLTGNKRAADEDSSDDDEEAEEPITEGERRRENRRREGRLTSKRRIASYRHMRFLARAAAIAGHTNDFWYVEESMRVVTKEYARNPRGFPVNKSCVVATVAAILKPT